MVYIFDNSYRPMDANQPRRPGQEGSVIPVIQVKLKRGESVEKALRRLKKIMDKEGTIKQLRANRYFEKPGDKRRKKSARARARANMR